MRRRRPLKRPFVLTTSIAIACGGATSGGDGAGGGGADGEAGRSSDGDGGIGAGGNSAAGAAGAPVCPPSVPAARERCSAPMECAYELDCASGLETVTYACVTPTGGSPPPIPIDDPVWWPSGDCSFPTDHCEGTRLSCGFDGRWEDYAGWGGNPPAPCPPAMPAPGEDCVRCGPCVGSSCGYRCESGAWTQGGCDGSFWKFDGACEGDCSKQFEAIAEYARENSQCTTDADCRAVESTCSAEGHSYGHAFYVNRNVDETTWRELDDALTACAVGGRWRCAQDSAAAAPASCYSGGCAPVTP